MNHPDFAPAMPVTSSFWFCLPDTKVWSEARFTHPNEETAKSLARRHWENLKILNYTLSGKP